MFRLIMLVYICLNLFCCSNSSQKKTIELSTHGAIRTMTKCDSIPTIVLHPDLATPFVMTDVRNLSNNIPVMTKIDYLALDESIGYIGEIKYILFIKDRIIIHDSSYNSEAVFIFDDKGKGIKKLEAGGRGPSEFFGIAQIYTFPKADFFVVRDSRSSRIQFFDLNGEHLKTENTLVNSSNCKPINDSVLLYGASYGQNYHIEDLIEYSIYSGVRDSILFKGLPYLKYQKSDWVTNDFFTNHMGELQIKQHANDSIYQLLNDSTYFIPYFVKFNNPLQEKMKNLKEGDDYGNIYWQYVKEGFSKLETFIENNNCILYSGIGDLGKGQIYLYDKEKNKLFKFNGKTHSDYPCKMLWSGQQPIVIHENRFVAALYGFDLYKTINTEIIRTNDTGKVVDTQKIEIDPSLSSLVKKVNENSNPVLMFFRFDFEYD